MTVHELAAACGLEAAMVCDGERTVEGAYAGDLLSWVMGRAAADNAFVTIMNNVNVIAVAALTDLSCVIFAEGVEIPDEVRTAAAARGINLLKSELPVYETCLALGKALSS